MTRLVHLSPRALLGLTLGACCGAGLFADDHPALEFRGEWRADRSGSPTNFTDSVTFEPAAGGDGGRVNLRAEVVVDRERRLKFAVEGAQVVQGRIAYEVQLARQGFLGAIWDGVASPLSIQGSYELDPTAGGVRARWTLSSGQQGADLLRRYGSGLGWKETPLGGSAAAEAAAIAKLEQRVHQIQDDVAGNGQRERGFHNKGFGMRGELRVLEELAPELRVGLFQPGARYPAIARFSNAQSTHQHDSKLDQRGLAFRVKTGSPHALLSGAHADAQDFLTTNSDVTARDPVQFLDFAELTVKDPLVIGKRLLDTYGAEETAHIARVLAGGTDKTPSMTSEPLWSSRAPLKWGPLAVKVALFPASTPPRHADHDHGELPLPIGIGPDHLREDMRARLRNGDLVLDMFVQRFDREETTPIEDASVRWRTPWERVAQLVIVQQDLNEEQARALEAEIEQLAFNPWHCTEDFRPLGSIMRARRTVYQASADHRGACPFGFGR